MTFLWFLLIGLIAGWIAEQLVSPGSTGLVGNLVVGVLGAFVGGFLFSQFGVPSGGQFGPLITATIGAIVLLLLMRMLRSSRV